MLKKSDYTNLENHLNCLMRDAGLMDDITPSSDARRIAWMNYLFDSLYVRLGFKLHENLPLLSRRTILNTVVSDYFGDLLPALFFIDCSNSLHGRVLMAHLKMELPNEVKVFTLPKVFYPSKCLLCDIPLLDLSGNDKEPYNWGTDRKRIVCSNESCAKELNQEILPAFRTAIVGSTWACSVLRGILNGDDEVEGREQIERILITTVPAIKKAYAYLVKLTYKVPFGKNMKPGDYIPRAGLFKNDIKDFWLNTESLSEIQNPVFAHKFFLTLRGKIYAEFQNKNGQPIDLYGHLKDSIINISSAQIDESVAKAAKALRRPKYNQRV